MSGADCIFYTALPESGQPTWTNAFESPVGWLQIGGVGEILTQCNYTTSSSAKKIIKQASSSSAHAKIMQRQLQAYFNNPASVQFNLPVCPAGTPFQQSVWQAICAIPAGETWTYGQLAKSLQSAAQAVGQALKRNPISIVIPCHRIVAKQGLGGYSGATGGAKLARKAWLLAREAG